MSLAVAGGKSIASTSSISTPDRAVWGIETPEEIRSRLSPDRVVEFHENTKILIVEDNPGTSQRLIRELSPLYGRNNLIVARSVRDAAAVLTREQEAGSPVRAVVLDLYLDGEAGIELLKGLPSNRPGVILHTASMMAPVVADTFSQIGEYESSRRLELLETFRAQAERRGDAPIPVFYHHKAEPLSILVDKIDTAILVSQDPAISKLDFYDRFKPAEFPADSLRELAHDFCAALVDLGRTIAPHVKRLDAEGDLRRSDWWRDNGEDALATLRRFSELHWSTVVGETPEVTRRNMHDLASMLLRLEPPKSPSDLSGSRLSMEHLDEWLWAYESGTQDILRLNESFRRELRAGFNPVAMVESFDRRFLPVDIREGSIPADFTEIADENKVARGILRDVLKFLDRRLGESMRSEVEFRVSFERAEDCRFDRRLARLKAIECGAYFEFYYSERGLGLEKALEPLAPALAELQREKKGFFEIGNDGYSEGFWLILKAQAPNQVTKSLRFSMVRDESLAHYRTEETIGRNKFSVYEIPGDPLPLRVLEPLEPDGLAPLKPILVQTGKAVYFVSHPMLGHFPAAELVVNREGFTAAPGTENLVREYRKVQIREDSVRMEMDGDYIFVNCDPGTGVANDVSQTLTKLGFKATHIKFDPSRFDQI